MATTWCASRGAPSGEDEIIRIFLGTGADQLLGSSRGEILYASGVETEVDRDIIDMAGGNDYVMLGNPARGTQVGPDVITLGGGRDVLAIFGPVAAATLAWWIGSRPAVDRRGERPRCSHHDR